MASSVQPDWRQMRRKRFFDLKCSNGVVAAHTALEAERSVTSADRMIDQETKTLILNELAQIEQELRTA